MNVEQAIWPAPPHVHACTTLRYPGSSIGPYAGLNLAQHVGDYQAHVSHNRLILRESLHLPADPIWLNQVHGTRILNADHPDALKDITADGCYTTLPNTVCAILTADCIPVLLCNASGTEIAAVHAGWRGLASGVLSAALNCFYTPKTHIMAWLGPAIGPSHFIVGDDVRQQFLNALPKQAEKAFRYAHTEEDFFADLHQLARIALREHGVTKIYTCPDSCTYQNEDRFFSYRKNPITGRMATLIWRT